ncbi:hypothetical protein [Bradyrhizobium cytisi]|uniref:Uncharacterized protein n=1 Tax=Bradyrhizobium cytisi TaxID=515489 RepID=A0A5S4X0S4_9BRAD|nr:hypothetical protein [Bradyrhizobium cytisi]TYL85960.1 hypothetical protein FXB38_10610 [Bradyrhizobium cytisi]
MDSHSYKLPQLLMVFLALVVDECRHVKRVAPMPRSGSFDEDENENLRSSVDQLGMNTISLPELVRHEARLTEECILDSQRLQALEERNVELKRLLAQELDEAAHLRNLLLERARSSSHTAVVCDGTGPDTPRPPNLPTTKSEHETRRVTDFVKWRLQRGSVE